MEADDMRRARHDIIRMLPVLVALAGCRGSGWSASMNSDTLSPAIGLSLGNQSKKPEELPQAHKQAPVQQPRSEKSATLASGSDAIVPAADMPKSDSANSSRNRQANWWSPRSWRRSTQDRIPLPITDQTTVEPTSAAPTDDF
jgi:hypothetical protein